MLQELDSCDMNGLPRHCCIDIKIRTVGSKFAQMQTWLYMVLCRISQVRKTLLDMCPRKPAHLFAMLGSSTAV